MPCADFAKCSVASMFLIKCCCYFAMTTPCRVSSSPELSKVTCSLGLQDYRRHATYPKTSCQRKLDFILTFKWKFRKLFANSFWIYSCQLWRLVTYFCIGRESCNSRFSHCAINMAWWSFHSWTCSSYLRATKN